MLSDKDRELIGIGASIAASCRPCTNFHLGAARIAGASDAEISRAISDARGVCFHAIEVMAKSAARQAAVPISDTGGQESALINELVSISAAGAVDSAPDLATHVAAARGLGATDGQILASIEIAGAVKRTAASKAEEAMRRAMGPTSSEPKQHCHPSGEEGSEPAVAIAGRACPAKAACGSGCGGK